MVVVMPKVLRLGSNPRCAWYALVSAVGTLDEEGNQGLRTLVRINDGRSTM